MIGNKNKPSSHKLRKLLDLHTFSFQSFHDIHRSQIEESQKLLLGITLDQVKFFKVCKIFGRAPVRSQTQCRGGKPHILDAHGNRCDLLPVWDALLLITVHKNKNDGAGLIHFFCQFPDLHGCLLTCTFCKLIGHETAERFPPISLYDFIPPGLSSFVGGRRAGTFQYGAHGFPTDFLLCV